MPQRFQGDAFALSPALWAFSVHLPGRVNGAAVRHGQVYAVDFVYSTPSDSIG